MVSISRAGVRISGTHGVSLGWLLEGVCAFMIAVVPIFQHYKGIKLDVSSELLILCFPFLCFRLGTKKIRQIAPVIPPVFYALYISFIHGADVYTLGREVILVFFYAAVLNGVIDIRRTMRAVVAIAELACFIEILQYLCYYGLHRHLQCVPTGMLLPSAEQWILLAKTGRIGVSGRMLALYRPSAFFLEPSHLAIYCIPALVFTLLSQDGLPFPDKRRQRLGTAFIISVGVLLSTSGLGLASVVALWGLYIVVYAKEAGLFRKIRIKDIFTPKTIALVGMCCVFLIVAYFTVGVFRSAVNRIFLTSKGESNSAIGGRTATGFRALRMLSGKKLLVGVGNSVDISNWNMSGFFFTVFKYGVIGCALSYWLHIKNLLKLKDAYFWLTVMFVGLSFFTVHTYAAFYRLYYISFILAGYWQQRQPLEKVKSMIAL